MNFSFVVFMASFSISIKFNHRSRDGYQWQVHAGSFLEFNFQFGNSVYVKEEQKIVKPKIKHTI